MEITILAMKQYGMHVVTNKVITYIFFSTLHLFNFLHCHTCISSSCNNCGTSTFFSDTINTPICILLLLLSYPQKAIVLGTPTAATSATMRPEFS